MFDDPVFRRIVTIMGWVAMAFLVFPVVLTITVSFNGSIFIEFPPKSFSLAWYTNIAEIHKIGEATLISLWIAVLTGVLTVAMSIPAAIALARHNFPGKGLLVAYLLSPVTVPNGPVQVNESGPATVIVSRHPESCTR